MLKKVLKASSILTSSNFIVAISGLFIISIIAKSLTIEEVGIFAIIQTYVLSINSLINFQTWYTVNKYYPSVKDDKDKLNSLLKYSYFLDIVTAIIGTIVSIILIKFIGNMINIDESYYFITQLFSLSILFNVTGTATGYFRNKDKYRVFLLSDVFSTIFKIIGISYCYFYSSNIESYLIVILISVFIKSIYINIFLLKNNYKNIFGAKISLIKKEFNDIQSYSIITSITNGFDLLFRQGDILVVSFFFGAYYAGIFKMIKTFGGLMGQVTAPISIVIYPIISELVQKNKLIELKQIMNKSIIILTIISIIGLIIFHYLANYLILLIFNETYLPYVDYLFYYIIIMFISTIFMALHPITNLINLHKEVMYLIIIKLPLFIIMIFFLKIYFDFYGFLIAVFIETIITILIKYYWIDKYFTKGIIK